MNFRQYGTLALVALLLIVYTLSHSSTFHIVDEVSLFAVTESLALRGEVDTNAIAWTQWVNSPGEVLGAFGPDGEVYSKKGPAPAFLAVTWYWLLRALAHMDVQIGLLQGTLLWNGFVTAATAVLLWRTANRLGYGDRTGATLGLLFGLCTIAWPYANQFFGEPLSALSLLLCFYGLLSWQRTRQVGWALAAGAGAGLAVTTVTAHALALAVLVAYAVWAVWRGERRMAAPGAWISAVLAFILPLVVAGGLSLWYNEMRFGNPFDTGYHFDSGEGFSTPLWQGLWGLVFSPYRGLFWFTPLFIASVASLPAFARRHRAEALATGAMSLALLLLYSLWWMWWGGFAWGPRFLVPLAPFWVLWLAPWTSDTLAVLRGVRETRREARWQARLRGLPLHSIALIVLSLVSWLVQVSAVVVNWVNFEIYLRSLYPTDWENPLAFGPPAQSLLDLGNSPVAGQWQLMRDNFVANTDLAWLWSDGNIQWLLLAVGLAALATAAGAFLHWWLATNPHEARTLPSMPVRGLIAVLPILVIGLWLGEVSRHPHYGTEGRGYRQIVEDICARADGSEALVTVAPYAYQIPMNWLGARCDEALPVYGYAPDSMEHPETGQVLDAVLQRSGRLLLVTGGLPANAPENSVERWLAENAYKANDTWYDDFRLLEYGTPLLLANAPLTPLNVTLIGQGTSQINLIAARLPSQARAGKVLPVEIAYRLLDKNTYDLRWFVQLLRPEGYAAALLDTAPADGYSPFSLLPANQDLVERAGLLLPDNLPAGQYELIAGLYNPLLAGAPRLRTPDGSDFVRLGAVIVE
ncbi:MAG: hypothetical protein DCC57_01445 [Chloroflexi bacterium]|nr:MAG: hypothetical protein DCC57_01445 [Chloroflexota bacterium]